MDARLKKDSRNRQSTRFGRRSAPNSGAIAEIGLTFAKIPYNPWVISFEPQHLVIPAVRRGGVSEARSVGRAAHARW